MELHFGVIRDREGIHAGLAESQATHRQLAVCYNEKDKLLVKICTVSGMEKVGGETTIVLESLRADGTHEHTAVSLDRIESIYPINDFPHQR